MDILYTEDVQKHRTEILKCKIASLLFPFLHRSVTLSSRVLQTVTSSVLKGIFRFFEVLYEGLYDLLTDSQCISAVDKAVRSEHILHTEIKPYFSLSGRYVNNVFRVFTLLSDRSFLCSVSMTLQFQNGPLMAACL